MAFEVETVDIEQAPQEQAPKPSPLRELGIEWIHTRLNPGQWQLQRRNAERQVVGDININGQQWKPKIFSPFGGGHTTLTQPMPYMEAKAWVEAEVLKSWAILLREELSEAKANAEY